MLAECWRGGMPVLAAAEAMINDAFGLREGDLWADADKDAEAFAQLTQFARARLLAPFRH